VISVFRRRESDFTLGTTFNTCVISFFRRRVNDFTLGTHPQHLRDLSSAAV
jgi:hypothetical protein